MISKASMRGTAAAAVLMLALTAAGTASAQNVAVVNGKPISKAKADQMVKDLIAQGQKDSPQLQGLVRQELITREVFMQEAEKRGLAGSAEVKAQLEQARQQIIIGAMLRDFSKKNPVKDEDVKAEYEKFKAERGSEKEFRARHILVEKEDQAKALIEQLKKGAKFEDLAKQSKDTGSAQRGGDLDWAQPNSFVKPFSDAMTKLEKGKFTEAPVQSEFGWHIIRLDDVREAKFPSFDEVKPRIQEMLQRQKLQKFQEDLMSKAKVE